jgi:hypothetical protein
MKKKDVAQSCVLKDRECIVCGNKFDVGEYWECEYCSGYFKERVKEYMVKNWGTRCPDYEKDCACCKAWKYFDYLFEIDE